MKTSVLIVFFLCAQTALWSQFTISGIVTDSKNTPIIGANVYLVGTYDGATSNENGRFSFETSQNKTQTLIVSYVSFEPYKITDEVLNMNDL